MLLGGPGQVNELTQAGAGLVAKGENRVRPTLANKMSPGMAASSVAEGVERRSWAYWRGPLFSRLLPAPFFRLFFPPPPPVPRVGHPFPHQPSYYPLAGHHPLPPPVFSLL